MNTSVDTVQTGIWHKDYNLAQQDSLAGLPGERSVFAIFAMIDDEPVNCRYVGESENLALSIRELFENPGVGGIGKFMQGPWIKMVKYELMPGSSKEDRVQAADKWTLKYKPGIDGDGDYPGYY